MKLRIACLQFNPVIGKVDQNISKIKKLLSKCKKDFDLLVLPELSITGYNFHSPKELEPYLEQQGKGRSFQVANELSDTFKCTTVIGYPETCDGTTYNSAMVVDKWGKLISNYRKTHMYKTDEVWGCSENPDKTFPPVNLTFPGKNGDKVELLTNIGICMDLNPRKFEAPFHSFEFSSKTWHHDSSLIIVPTAWLSSESPSEQNTLKPSEKQELMDMYRDFISSCQGNSDAQTKSKKPSGFVQKLFETSDFVTDSRKPSKSLIEYWIMRFYPYLVHPSNKLPKKNHKTTVVLCNRSGMEDDVVYGGSSCILQFDPSSGGSVEFGMENPSVRVLVSAGQASEEVIYHEVDI